jgi:DivIVA domain-containing protein
MSDLITQIEQARFTPVRLRSGYDMGEVDQLLDEIVAALSAGRPVEPLIDGARITTVSFREGYDMAEVDALIARVRAHDPGSPVPPPAPVSPTTSGVVEEQQGLLSRLFGRRSG